MWNQGTYRLDNLVYHRSNKCAGTFFSELFLKNGWQEIQADQINNSDVHFGIIIDPVVRRAKAITERIFMANIKEQIDNPQFLRFIADICVVDEHNIPYYVQFKHLKDIKLFPLFDNIFGFYIGYLILDAKLIFVAALVQYCKSLSNIFGLCILCRGFV